MKKTTLKKIRLFYLIALFFFAINTISAQNCVVYDDLTLSQRTALGISNQPSVFNNINSLGTYFSTPVGYPLTPKKFRIQIWNVRSSDGSTGVWVPYHEAVEYIKTLNSYYKDYNICFVLTGVGVLHDDNVLNGAWHYNFRNSGMVNNAYLENAINVYMAPSVTPIPGVGGVTNYYEDAIAIRQPSMYDKALLAHEVAHALGIMHTIGSVNDIPNSPNGMGSSLNCEHVTRDPNDPNYNADNAGDYVRDTAADPGLRANSAHPYYNIDANCNYFGTEVNCDGTSYQVDSALISNIMSYGGSQCKIGLSLGQAERIHYGIDNAPANNRVKKALITDDNDFGYDFVIRDGEDDFGDEPNTATQNFWTSPDIWIRTTNDNNLSHENPVYGIGNNYIKVRVVNRGCSISDGEGKLKLYWTKAGTNLPMDVWESGTYNVNGYPLGGLIGEIDLPALESYEEHIFTFPWSVPNPANYSTINEPWHYCLMAKIASPNDVSTLPEHNGVYYHFLNSNNIALKNVHVINNTSSNSGKIQIGNFTGAVKKFKLKLSNYISYNSNTNIFNEAEVKFTFDNKLWSIWQSSGLQGSNFTNFGEKTIIVNEDTEIFLNNFPVNDFGVLNVKVNFLTDAYTNNDQFGFNVEHWDNETNELMGGELYLVNKNQRDLFEADAVVTNNTLSAVTINEPAVYNWYDANGTLLHTGQNYTISNTNGTYLLEVVADYDGYKDMKEVTVVASNPTLIHNIYPNPATSNVTIQYNQLNCNNAYLMLVNVNNNASANYILNLNNTNINIDTSQYTPGLYRVVLVCDNNVTESHNLIIQ